MNTARIDVSCLAKWMPPAYARSFAFYVLVPLLLALFTATDTGFNRHFGYVGAMVYVSLFALANWWTADLATRVVKACLAHWKPRLWVLTLTGALLACVAVAAYAQLLSDGFHALGFPATQASEDREPQWSETLMQSARAVVFWMTANHVFHHYLGLPRFTYVAAADAPVTDEPVVDTGIVGPDCTHKLLRSLKACSSLEDILAIKAEEHYVRVISREGAELVLYRFSQVLVDLAAEDGFRVHRSYWVRKGAIVSRRINGKGMDLLLSNGAVIPVSRRYHELLNQVIKVEGEPSLRS
ncbi:LytTR family DNA-binding domain-containing protein [Pseudomonas sp. L5B5]|uniref:LytTR family DNA-binding domain-containing protein n=1 Tax=Pseudomonas sp. L5B5 TaxID=2883205 RepID=UPI001CFB4A37|nr:LytTR family DNA-binding domain-containing protein [Pseudomonas sp. L5B5]UCZ83876.1 LytTR family transcriptional regulator [Pseudomonas sp. L5B5]